MSRCSRDGVMGPRRRGPIGQRARRAGAAALAASFAVAGMLAGVVSSTSAGASAPAPANSGVISPCGSASPGHETCFIEVVKPKVAKPATATAHPAYTLGTWPTALHPSDITKAYGWSSSDVNTGTGKTIAIVDAYGDPTIASNLTHFSSEFSLPACTSTNGCFKKVNQTGGTSYPTETAGWDFETSLDTEYVHAMAPKAHIILVEADTSSDISLFTAVTYAAAHAQYVSMSWGGDRVHR